MSDEPANAGMVFVKSLVMSTGFPPLFENSLKSYSASVVPSASCWIIRDTVIRFEAAFSGFVHERRNRVPLMSSVCKSVGASINGTPEMTAE